MKFVYSCRTDTGTTRAVNQDALVIKTLNYRERTFLLAAVCDGVGGLQQGEVASRKASEMLSAWFDLELPQIVNNSRFEEVIGYRCRQLLEDINKEIYYGNIRGGISSGTTISMLLFWDCNYLIGHIGDSRIYEITRQIRQLTRDHSFLAREIEFGRMTLREAALDSRKNIILKCIGAEAEAVPDILRGVIYEPAVFLLCTDGFWNYMERKEWIGYFAPQMINGGKQLGKLLQDMTERLKRLGEMDNITAIAIEVC